MRASGPYLLLALFCAVFFWRIWTPDPIDRASFVSGDFSDQFYTFARYQSERLWDGQLPLWNPYVLAGHPFLADVQSATFYPPRLMTILLSGRGGLTYFALEWEAIAHLFLAGALTYAFARRLFADRSAAWVAAIVFAFGGYLTSYPMLQLAILETIIWLPLILLLIDHALSADAARTRHAATIGAGLVWAVALLAGHPQTAMQSAYFAILYGAWRTYSTRAGWREATARLLAFGLIGLGAAAIQVIPSFEFTQQSTRLELGYDAAAGGFPLRDVIQMLLPGTTSVWSPLYVGILPLFLAAIFFTQRSQRSWFWLLAAVGALLLSFGGATFLYALLYRWLPGFDLFRSQERAAGLVSLALAIAAAGGFAALRLSDERSLARALQRVGSGLIGGLLLIIALLFTLWQLSAAPDVRFALDRAVFALFLTLATFALWRLRAALREHVWVVASIALIAFDLFSINWQTNLEFKPPEAQAQLPQLVDALRVPDELFRIDDRMLLPGNWGNLAELHSVNGSSPLVIANYATLRETFTKEREWQLFNVKYVATTDDSLGLPAERIAQETIDSQTINLFRLTTPAPRVWIVHRTRVLDDDEALAVLQDANFDLLSEAIVSEPVTVETTSGVSTAQVLAYAPEHIVIDTNANSAALLIVNELYYPGWRAIVDGHDAPIARADVALRGVALAPGAHRVEMVFQPLSVLIGAGISVAVWIGGIVALLLLRRRSA